MKALTLLAAFTVLMTSPRFAASDEPGKVAAQPEDRFQVAVHDCVKDGTSTEILLKLDRFTGQSWRFEGAREGKWILIPEQNEREKPSSGDASRYELVCHSFTKDGNDHEIYVRFDRQTGKSWRWSGNEPGWKAIEQVK